jgi:hypothetical protein
MEIKDLVGKHKLDGVDFYSEEIESYGPYEDSEVCRFRLDGTVYAAVEDPDDGYRSHLRELKVLESNEMDNTFPAIEVVGRHRTDGGKWRNDDVLELIDVNTGQVVLEIGTENYDDWYPYFVANFDPKAMVTNT